MEKLRWRKKFHNAAADFVSKELEMEFENEVEIESITNGQQEGSPKIPFNPEGAYSKKIEIEFPDSVPPIQKNLMIWFQAEKEPFFKKVVWSNKKDNHSYEFNQDQLDVLNS